MRNTTVASALLLALAPAAHAGIDYDFRYDYRRADGVLLSGGATGHVHTNTPFYAEETTPVIVNWVGSGQVRTEVRVSGRADTRTREFGASARVIADVAGYDPQHPPGLDTVFRTSAEAAIRFGDRITPWVPSLPVGAALTVEFAPVSFHGALGNSGWVTSTGGASVSAILSAMPVAGVGLIGERTFDEALLPDELNRSYSGVAALFSNLVLSNGVAYDWTLEMRTYAGIYPAVFEHTDPPRSEAWSEFGNTLRWGGITAVRDASGAALQGFTLASAEGFDWVSPVPEPGAAALLAAGVALLAWRRTWRATGDDHAHAGGR